MNWWAILFYALLMGTIDGLFYWLNNRSTYENRSAPRVPNHSWY